MSLQQHAFAPHPAALSGPHPVALETIELLEQALAGMLSGLRRGPNDLPADVAGVMEYESWFVNLRQ